VQAVRPGSHLRHLAAPRTGLRDAGTWLHWLDEAFAAAPARMWHSRAVWHRVASGRRHELRWLSDDRFETLELAALLHDVGRAIDPANLEPHGFVGARFLDSIGLHDVAPLVAHHSGARDEARDRGMAHHDVWQSDTVLLEVLTYIDRTTGPRGDAITLDERRADLIARYGDDAAAVRWFDASLHVAHAGAAHCTPRISLSA
jgi:predicted HD phosphohydrolase